VHTKYAILKGGGALIVKRWWHKNRELEVGGGPRGGGGGFKEIIGKQRMVCCGGSDTKFRELEHSCQSFFREKSRKMWGEVLNERGGGGRKKMLSFK